jgi:manganese/zinc/iron transport system permease protein
MNALLHDLVFDYTLRNVALGASLLGLTSGALGAFAVLRRQSLLGDAVSHTALPGIVLAFMLTGSKEPWVLLGGAATAGLFATLSVTGIVGTSRVKYDSALGLVLSVFFGFGLVLLTFVQRQPTAGKAGLDKFLFGQASALVSRDVLTIAIVGCVVLLGLLLFWKEFKLLGFDREFGTSLGFSMRAVDLLLTTLLVFAIVLGLQTVGVVLMSAMVVAPAVAAQQWTDRLGTMVILSGIFGAAAGVSGAVISSLVLHLPTGPTIVLAASVLVAISLLFAPRSGLVWNAFARRRRHRRLRLLGVLLDLSELSRQHTSLGHPHNEAALQSMTPEPANIRGSLEELQKLGWVRKHGLADWSLTREGALQAERVFTDMQARP